MAERAQALGVRVLESTFPRYQADERGDPDVVGSAILMVLDSAKFLISASHVFRARPRRTQLALIVDTIGRGIRVDPQVTKHRATTAGAQP